MFLNDHHRGEKKEFSSSEVVDSLGISVNDVRPILSQLCDEEIINARINVRCPECDTDFGRFDSKSEVPKNVEKCFSCGHEFEMRDKEAWHVVYDTKEIINQEDVKNRLKKYVEECYNLNQDQIEREFEDLEELSPQKRGRLFDYFIGLLFLQVEGVDVRVQQRTKEGEVDVHLILSEAERILRDTCGTHTMVENKWIEDPVEQSEIVNFHNKVSSIQQQCYLSYFVSMSGFTDGADTKLDNFDNPGIISWNGQDVEEMVYENDLRNKLIEDNLR